MTTDIKWDNEAPTLASEEGIKWDTAETAAPEKPKQRAESTFKGATAEFLKGLPRGAVDYFTQLGKGLNPGNAVPENMRPAIDPGVGQLKQQFDQAVAPDPQATGLERFSGATGEFVGGFAGGSGPRAASTSRAAFPTPPLDATTETMRRLHEAGVRLSANNIGGVAARTAEGLSGKAHNDVILQNKNIDIFRNRASQATGVPAVRLTEDTIDAASREVADRTYQPIRDLVDIHFGSHNVGTNQYSSTFQRELSDIQARYASAEGHASLDNAVNSLRVREMPANVALERIQQIRNDAGAAFKRGDRNIGRALREVSGAMESQVERNLAQRQPQTVVQAYREGRQQIARNNAVKDMLVDRSTGVIDPVKAYKLAEDGVPLDGPLTLIAEAGSPLFASATKAPKGKAPTLDTIDLLSGAGGVGAGVFTGGLGLGALAVPAARIGMRQGLTSQMGQNVMARKLYDQPQMLGMSPEFLQRMMTGGTGLFSDGSQ